METSAMESATHKECWERACDCFATAKIFEKRALGFHNKIDFLAYLGIGVPATFGALVLAWGKDVLSLTLLMSIFSVLGVIQVIVSVSALVKKWPEQMDYSNESAAANFQLSEDFKILGATATCPPSDLSEQFNILVTKDQSRSQQDSKKHVTDKEKIWGHRHALRQFSRKCAKCNIVPTNMNPTECSVCGEFK